VPGRDGSLWKRTLLARKLKELGHTVKLMAPQFVKPYVKTNKNDVADAEAICEAVSRPSMRFVPVKTGEQQAVLSLRPCPPGLRQRTHRAGEPNTRTAGEYGIVIPVGINNIAKHLPDILEDGENDLPGVFRQLLQRLGDHLKELDRQVDELDRQVDELSGQIQLWHKENELSLKLADIPGIGR